MPKKRKTPVEELVVPPQDHRICGTICVCQMTAILSSVAIVYLSVAIYFPSFRAFYSGIIEDPVMCSTSKVVTVDKCNWGSCGEWCLSKTSGSCVQIYVNLRQNGTTLDFQNCTNSYNKTCYGIDQDNVKRYRCKLEECKNLTGTFNCTTGSCINITDVFECIFHNTEDPLNCTGPRGKINCMDIDGLNTCEHGICSKINTPYNCDRRCVDIPTRNKNVILLNGDRVFLSQCQKVYVEGAERENGSWNATQLTTVLASCYYVTSPVDSLQAIDCINGTIVDKRAISDRSNFTFLHSLTILNESRTLQEREIAPPEVDLLIANDSRLMINLEGCVNTLKDECKQFIKEYGKDGADHNARARFPCYYSEENPSMVVSRFNMEVTYREFYLAAIIPAVLLVVSCLTLILCQRTVEVGDDAKMRFKRRGGGASAQAASNIDTIGDKGGGSDRLSVNL
ncbi:uncharacterized protein LOC135847351 isoform X1 [Planococcus citri]|uniref:uncharacterized protein LOC135847351 isoform X1 n=1 Tax=Planococcus citri TaxID=170843 RepID=UPI0031F9E6AD